MAGRLVVDVLLLHGTALHFLQLERPPLRGKTFGLSRRQGFEDVSHQRRLKENHDRTRNRNKKNHLSPGMRIMPYQQGETTG